MRFRHVFSMAFTMLFVLLAAKAQTVTFSGGYNGPDFASSSGSSIGYGSPDSVASSFPSSSGVFTVVNYTFSQSTVLQGFTATSGAEPGNSEASMVFLLFDNGKQFSTCTWNRSSAGSSSNCSASFVRQFNAGDSLSMQLIYNDSSNSTLFFIGNDSWTLTGQVPVTQQFWTLQSDQTTPLALPTTDTSQYGATQTCSVSSPCPNPLVVTFDTMNGVLAHLDGGGYDMLTTSNSVDSSDGGVQSLAFTNWCNPSAVLALTDTEEDGTLYPMSGSALNQPCSSGTGLTGSGVLSGLTFTLTTMSDPAGTYTGSFSGAAGPSTISLTINPDFSVGVSAILATGSLCPAQTSTLSLTSTNPEAINNGPGGGVSGFITGGAVLVSLADNLGNVTWMIGTDTDADGNQLAPGALFFTSYTLYGACNGQYTYDAPFHKRGASIKPVRHHRHHHVPRQFRERIERERKTDLEGMPARTERNERKESRDQQPHIQRDER